MKTIFAFLFLTMTSTIALAGDPTVVISHSGEVISDVYILPDGGDLIFSGSIISFTAQNGQRVSMSIVNTKILTLKASNVGALDAYTEYHDEAETYYYHDRRNGKELP